MVETIARSMCMIAGVALTLSMLLTVSDVILRTLKHPITGTFELVGLLGAVVIGFSLPETSRVRGHVIMHFLTERLPDRALGGFTCSDQDSRYRDFCHNSLESCGIRQHI